MLQDPHLRDQHQHGPQHQPHRRLRLLGPERSRCAERLRGSGEAPGAVQDQEPQRIMGGLGERGCLGGCGGSVEGVCVGRVSVCVVGESSVLRQSQPERQRLLQVSSPPDRLALKKLPERLSPLVSSQDSRSRLRLRNKLRPSVQLLQQRSGVFGGGDRLPDRSSQGRHKLTRHFFRTEG